METNLLQTHHFGQACPLDGALRASLVRAEPTGRFLDQSNASASLQLPMLQPSFRIIRPVLYLRVVGGEGGGEGVGW